ncbi:M81 family metallopeptidase [Paenibacillus sacheonensis]|uniref:MlrC n=1 Tax=Paenibacillus sacheonensis TaxID=742054 RepID=A0A7X4YUZ4_9BACL|nr:M81 family metallopeptidase [Paenibacillus sacheonensis]MBM7568385.1 microcystin degradation protein MlrC [Paenibacillus sacheonensis]NBC72084.1 hypothetical protein [Paenibacillus sacheonensis]
MKILVGAIVQESNTFSPYRSGLEDFRGNIHLLGEEMLGLEIENEVRGSLQALQDNGAEALPTLCLYAVSAGRFGGADFSALEQLMTERVLAAAEECDGVFFAMHGAMSAEGCDDVEGRLSGIIRSLIGDKPFVLSLDLHANITREMVRHPDAIVGYRTFPHTDFYETGYRATELLLSMLRTGRRPSMAYRKIPMIIPAENQQTMYGPFAELWAEASAGEADGMSAVTSIFPVQCWLDVEESGASVIVVGEDREKAEQEADRMAALFWDKRHAFDVQLHSVAEIVELARRLRGTEGPIVISDSADSPGAGSTGDSAAVLRQLLACGAEKDMNALLVVTDAPAVAAAIDAGVGREVSLSIGHTLNPAGEPIAVRGTVVRIGDGRFRLGGGHAKNTVARMGRCVVLEIGRISLLIGERAVFSGDPSMYRTMGLEPTAADIVMVKSASQFRADYDALSRHIYILDTPGSSPANIRSLPFEKLARPFYPFDDDFDWRKSQGYEN